VFMYNPSGLCRKRTKLFTRFQFPCIFHIKLLQNIKQSNNISDFDYFVSTKAKKYVVDSSYFQIILRSMFFKSQLLYFQNHTHKIFLLPHYHHYLYYVIHDLERRYIVLCFEHCYRQWTNVFARFKFPLYIS
jgi:hypothetical protein